MNFRHFAVAATLLASATTVLAQPTVTVKLTDASVPGATPEGYGPVPWNGVYVSPYTGLLTQTVGTTTSSQSIIMNCVDYFHTVSLGQTWTAYKSVLYDGADLSKTRFNNATLYLQAAWLSWQVPAQPSLNDLNKNTTIAIQTAIWNILTPTAPDKTNGTLQTNQGWWMTEAAKTANYSTANTGQFFILTAVYKDDSKSAQEFLYYDPNAPVVTPEPGTLTLLGTGIAGLAGWHRRRKRKSSGPAVAA